MQVKTINHLAIANSYGNWLNKTNPTPPVALHRFLSTKTTELVAAVTHEIIHQEAKSVPSADRSTHRPPAHLPGTHDNAKVIFLLNL